MDIKLPIKIHNKFEIEVKDIITGEIVQKGYAENIVLNNLFSAASFGSDTTTYFGKAIQFGSGTGTLSGSRTTLFNRIGGKATTNVDFVQNQPPLASYNTSKIVIAPSEHIGASLTEVGIGDNDSGTTIYTHALIKDSEGNPLVLGPKTDTQEITIYATVYFALLADSGVTLRIQTQGNALTKAVTGNTNNNFKVFPTNANPRIYSNGSSVYTHNSTTCFTVSGNVFTTPKFRLETNIGNAKIKSLGLGNDYTDYRSRGILDFDLEIMATNNSTIWSGYEFDKTPIGIGTGSQTVFNLTWDEAWLEKPKKVYVDGVEVLSGFTFNAGNITFDTAPADQAVITADYWVKYVPKDINHVLDIQIILTFGEGTPT